MICHKVMNTPKNIKKQNFFPFCPILSLVDTLLIKNSMWRADFAKNCDFLESRTGSLPVHFISQSLAQDRTQWILDEWIVIFRCTFNLCVSPPQRVLLTTQTITLRSLHLCSLKSLQKKYGRKNATKGRDWVSQLV